MFGDGCLINNLEYNIHKCSVLSEEETSKLYANKTIERQHQNVYPVQQTMHVNLTNNTSNHTCR